MAWREYQESSCRCKREEVPGLSYEVQGSGDKEYLAKETEVEQLEIPEKTQRSVIPWKQREGESCHQCSMLVLGKVS